MKNIILLTISMALIGCATTSQPNELPLPNRIVTDEFDVYFRLFEVYAKQEGVEVDFKSVRTYLSDIKLELGDINSKTIGICVRDSDKLEIFIDSRYWSRSTSLEREMTIFHELGHCVLDLKHDSSMTKTGKPKSLMYPLSFSSRSYYIHYKYYIKQLFTLYKSKKFKIEEDENFDKECFR